MGVKIRDLGGAIVDLQQRGEMISRVAHDGLFEVAEQVQELAQAYVPIDEHNLQDAISIRETEDGYQVYIDEAHPGTRAANVGEYAFKMHEGVGWSGIAKAGWPRGAKFMSRAANEIEDSMPTTIIPTIQSRINAVASGSKSFFGRIGRAIKGLFE